MFVLDLSGPSVPIRIFTPQAELPFAGHPVLGTAFVLAETNQVDSVTLEPPKGPVPVALRRQDGRVVYGEMEQPLPEPLGFDRTAQLLSALRIEVAADAPAAYTNGPQFVYVGLETERELAELRPDLAALEDLGQLGVSCFAGRPPQLRTRVFAPGLGVPEDPATGSAAGPLAVHLVRLGRLEYGQPLEIHQGIEIGRPSILQARVDGSGEQVHRVCVGGAAVVVGRGEYRLA